MVRGSGGERAGLSLAPGSQRIHGSVARTLGVAILSGRHAPGEVLPGEIDFSEQLGVSRTAYREAIRILSAKGLVESRPKTGTRVSARSRWNFLDPDVLAWTFETEPSEALIRDLFELRQIVEPAAAALAATRRSAADLQRMKDALATMARVGLAKPEGNAADRAFHHAILEAARNEPLLTLSSSIAAVVNWTTLFKQRRMALPRDPLRDHERVYEAISAGDPAQAREQMSDLIRLALVDTEMSMRG